MDDVTKKIIEIIASNFPNGIRDDFIDTNKVRRIYAANHADENISPNVIAEVIRTNGIENGGRFYFVDAGDVEAILLVLDELLAQYPIVYYSVAHEKHANFFAQFRIFSPAVLKKIWQKTCTDYFFADEFCSASRMTRPDYELAKIFTATGNALSLDRLQSKLPYVPTEKISALLSDAKRYLSTTAGKFLPVSKIKFDRDEIHAAERQIFLQVEAKGYAVPEDYDLSANFALNPELAEKDLLNVIYEKFLAANFTKRGKKFYPKGAAAPKRNSVKELRKFIAAHDELSPEKIFAVAENLGLAQHAALSAAYEMMIRVSKDSFVRDALINFDIDAVDEVLTPFVQGKIISLRSVTSFTGFPPVGAYSWNLFLLESFLRKYSRKYVYDAPAANGANIGAIYPQSMKFANYLDVQVAVIVQEKIPLEKSAVENFLVDNGYRMRRISKVTNEIIFRAQEILHR